MTTYGSDPLGTTSTDDFGTTDVGYASTGSGTPGADASDASTTDTAKDAASTAAEQSKHVAGTAKDEAANVAGTAAEQARNVVGDARQQVTGHLSDQATTGRDKLSETLRTLGDDLQQMAQGQGPAEGMANDIAQQVSDRVRALGSHLENREPSQLLDDARDFARRKPGTFLLGALAAGVVAGRLFRATADGAAAASLADTSDAPVRLDESDNPAAAGYDAPAPAGYDTPAATAPSFDPTSPEVPGQRTQDLP